MLEKAYGENFIMVRTLIGLKVVSSMFAIGMAAGMGIMGLCKCAKGGTGGKSEIHNSDGSNENSISETS